MAVEWFEAASKAASGTRTLVAGETKARRIREIRAEQGTHAVGTDKAY